MYRDLRIAAIVPAFCEEELIGKTIAGMPSLVDEIVVVDDASPDRTAEIVSSSPDPRVTLIRLSRNSGIGGAITTGQRHAVGNGADIMVTMAGDDQMDPVHLPALLDPIVDDGFGFAKGNRLYSREALTGMPRHRVIGNMFLTFLNKASTGYWHIADPQNGYTAITAKSWAQVPVDRVAKRYEYENDVLTWLNIAGVRATDVRIPARYGSERSTLRLRSFVPRLLLVLFRGFWRRMWLKYMLFSFSPIALLLLAGLFSLAVGIGFGVLATVVAINGVPTAGTTVLSAVPFMCGFILLTQAMVLDIQESPD